MAQFISSLGSLIGSSQGKSARDGYPQPRVADKTGLAGTYTFIFEYCDQGAANPAGANAGVQRNGATPVASEPDGGGPNIFAAVQKRGSASVSIRQPTFPWMSSLSKVWTKFQPKINSRTVSPRDRSQLPAPESSSSPVSARVVPAAR